MLTNLTASCKLIANLGLRVPLTRHKRQHTVITLLLEVKKQICKQQSKVDNEVRQMAKSDETTRRS
ncbi:7,8-dihydro-6-hydroxymethylpterin-pyrophosphokinase [Bradyrhizobium sp. USDA 3686]|uniref:hypothetical protein n=1 Tax=Bradyrhizobium canariense TaxID=255045 RepID=UPI001956C2CD|nr:hypothetical protein [Bradyrhizobium canariense]MBM7487890.1 7,8-dihydro-6-hydroxymethylpterin-pyrophosphokinase [Bradyrhizobium canariense]